MLDFILPAAFILAFTLLPGILFSLAFFRGLPIGVFSKSMLGVIFGLLFVPLLSLAESLFFGVKYGFAVVLVNSLILWAVAVAALYLRGMLSPKPFEERASAIAAEFSSLPYKTAIPKYGAFLLLLGLLGLSFYVRYATSAEFNFFEFDPVYYERISEVLVQQGEIPAYSFDVYWPLGRSLRGYPLVHYITVEWMHAANALGNLQVTKEFVVAFSQLYPPLMGLLISFLVYLLFKELFFEAIGLIAAGVFAFMPQLVKKFAAGVSELQPFGVFAAIFIFTAFGLYLKHRDTRFAAMAGFAALVAVLGSAQSIWPFLILAVSVVFLAPLDFKNKQLSLDSVYGQAMIFAGALIGSTLLKLFQAGALLELPNSVLFLLLGALFYAVFWLIERHGVHQLEALAGWTAEKARERIPLALLALGFLAVLLVPALNARVFGYVVAATQFATSDSALGKTVAEENATNPGFYPSSFGSLNPEVVLWIAFIVISALPIFRFFKRDRIAGILALLLLLSVTLFNPLLDGFLGLIARTGVFGDVASFTDFITTSDVFLFTIVSVLLLFLDSYYNGTNNRELIFLSITVFPVSYIGIRKLKYLLHLGVSLSLTVPLALGQAKRVFDYFAEMLSGESDKRILFHSSMAVVLLVGLFVGLALAGTVPQSMEELKGNRIPSDWLEAYDWMRNNTAMSEANCVNEYGYDCRVLSWWDYGHWTTFFGGKKSVLDPGNVYPQFDQEVAKAFVDGNPEDLKYTVNYHQATHILVDSDLISKWGALVFLSGSCSKKEAPTCFDAPPIDFRLGAGQHKYELEHYFETLQPLNQQCPQGVSPIPLPAYRSSLSGGVYCLSKSHLLLLTQQGIDSSYKREYKLVGRDEVDSRNINANVSYLFPVGSGAMINVNPGLSYAGISNNAVNAAFTRLYFFEQLPGTEMAYRSKNSMVKIFKITKGGPLLP